MKSKKPRKPKQTKLSKQAADWLRRLEEVLPELLRVIKESPNTDPDSQEVLPEGLLAIRTYLAINDVEGARHRISSLGSFIVKTNTILPKDPAFDEFWKLRAEIDPPTGWVKEIIDRVNRSREQDQEQK